MPRRDFSASARRRASDGRAASTRRPCTSTTRSGASADHSALTSVPWSRGATDRAATSPNTSAATSSPTPRLTYFRRSTSRREPPTSSTLAGCVFSTRAWSNPIVRAAAQVAGRPPPARPSCRATSCPRPEPAPCQASPSREWPAAPDAGHEPYGVAMNWSASKATLLARCHLCRCGGRPPGDPIPRLLRAARRRVEGAAHAVARPGPHRGRRRRAVR